jgi:hypothetical protein
MVPSAFDTSTMKELFKITIGSASLTYTIHDLASSLLLRVRTTEPYTRTLDPLSVNDQIKIERRFSHSVQERLPTSRAGADGLVRHARIRL